MGHDTMILKTLLTIIIIVISYGNIFESNYGSITQASWYNSKMDCINSEIFLNHGDSCLIWQEAFEYIAKTFYDARVMGQSQHQQSIQVSKDVKEIEAVNPLLNPFMREMFTQVIERSWYNVSSKLKQKIAHIDLYQQQQFNNATGGQVGIMNAVNISVRAQQLQKLQRC